MMGAVIAGGLIALIVILTIYELLGAAIRWFNNKTKDLKDEDYDD